MHTIGFIGTGHLTDFIVRGLRRGGWEGSILVTARSRSIALKLQETCRCQIVDNSQQLIDSCTIICLSVRGKQVGNALEHLVIDSPKILLSFVAGMPIQQLQQHFQGDCPIVRAMPITAAEVCASPTMLFPSNPDIEALLAYCGDPIALNREDEFFIADTIGCTYAAFLALYGELSELCQQLGMEQKTARQAIYRTFSGAAQIAAKDLSISAETLANQIACDGSFSKLALEHLRSRQAFQPWHEAMLLLRRTLGK